MAANYNDMVGLESLGVTPTPAPQLLSEPDLFSDLLPGEHHHIPLDPQSFDEDSFESQNPKLPMTPWPARLPQELALGLEDEASILDRYGISPARYTALKQNLSFRRALAEAQKQVRDEGLVFKTVCGRMSDEMLEDIYLRFFDPKTPLTLKHELFKTVSKFAGREPQPAKDTGPVTQAVQININL